MFTSKSVAVMKQSFGTTLKINKISPEKTKYKIKKMKLNWSAFQTNRNISSSHLSFPLR